MALKKGRGRKLWEFLKDEEGREKVAESMTKPFRNFSKENGKISFSSKGEKKLILKRISGGKTIKCHMGDRISVSNVGDLIPGEEIQFFKASQPVIKSIYNLMSNWEKDEMFVHLFVKKFDKTSKEGKKYHTYKIAIFLANRFIASAKSDSCKDFPFTYIDYDNPFETLCAELEKETSFGKTSPQINFSYSPPTLASQGSGHSHQNHNHQNKP